MKYKGFLALTVAMATAITVAGCGRDSSQHPLANHNAGTAAKATVPVPAPEAPLAAPDALQATAKTAVDGGNIVLAAAKKPAPMAAPETAKKPPDDARYATVEFSRVIARFTRGTRIGVYRPRFGRCLNSGPISWNGGYFNGRDKEISEIVNEELSAAGFTVPGQAEENMFEPRKVRAPFLIGAEITDLNIIACDLKRHRTISGEARITVKWQVYSRDRREIVHRATTTGFFKSKAGMNKGVTFLMIRAFAEAAAEFVIDDAIRSALLIRAAPSEEDIRPVAKAPLSVPKRPLFSGRIAKNIGRIQRATVTILPGLSGEGHGSGFFITDKGHILTNYHVVQDNDRVRIRLSMGAELLGRVERRHKERDVALVRIDAHGTQPMPIRPRPASVGEDVYAVGTPMDEQLTATVTRGVVRALRRRVEDGLLVIQADVGVHGGTSGGPLVDRSGNVIGITVSGYQRQGMGAGINFFIPIDDALAKLNIRLGKPAPAQVRR